MQQSPQFLVVVFWQPAWMTPEFCPTVPLHPGNWGGGAVARAEFEIRTKTLEEQQHAMSSSGLLVATLCEAKTDLIDADYEEVGAFLCRPVFYLYGI